MSAPVNEQVKAEAAKSLLERMKEKTKLVRFFRYNASAKHGVPIDAEETIDIAPDESQAKEESVPAQNIVQIVKTESDDDDRVTRLEQQLEAERQLREQQERDRQLREQQERDRQSNPANTGNQEPSPPATMSDKVKGILQTLAVLGGLGAAGWAGYAMTNGDSKDGEPKGRAPYYSPYQYLEDTENHLP